MGLSDIPPPTTSSLKRCRSEDPLSVAELYSPPLKQPALTSTSHHLSILEDLESSLNAIPTIEAAPTPEELVTEMMQSLEKVMGNIGELMAGSSDSCSPATNPTICVGSSSLQADELFVSNDQPVSSIGSAYTSSSLSEPLNLCRETAADCEESELACDKTILGNCLAMASNCDLASALGTCTGDVSDGELGRVATNNHVCTEVCVRHGCIGCDSIVHLLDASDDELGLTRGTEGTNTSVRAASTPAAEESDEQWNFIDELTDGFAFPALPSNQMNWLEEGYDLPAFTLSQIEEEGSVARDSTEFLLLDCYL